MTVAVHPLVVTEEYLRVMKHQTLAAFFIQIQYSRRWKGGGREEREERGEGGIQ